MQEPRLNLLWFAALAAFTAWALSKKPRQAADWLLIPNCLLCIFFIKAYYSEEMVQATGAFMLPLALASGGHVFWHSLRGLAPAIASGLRRRIWFELMQSLIELLLFGPAFSAGITEGMRHYGL